MIEIRDIARFTGHRNWWLIIDGLVSNTLYEFKQPTADTIVLCLPSAGPPLPDRVPAYQLEHDTIYNEVGTSDANGVLVYTSNNLAAASYHWVVYEKHLPTLAKGNNYNGTCLLAGSLENRLSWPPFDYASPGASLAYITGGTLTANPDHLQVHLNWSATTAIVEPGHLVYTVSRSVASNMSGLTVRATNITATSFLDTGLVDGTTYYYRVEARFKLDAWATPVGTDALSGNRNFTNIAQVTPRVRNESWGMIRKYA